MCFSTAGTAPSMSNCCIKYLEWPVFTFYCGEYDLLASYSFFMGSGCEGLTRHCIHLNVFVGPRPTLSVGDNRAPSIFHGKTYFPGENRGGHYLKNDVAVTQLY